MSRFDKLVFDVYTLDDNDFDRLVDEGYVHVKGVSKETGLPITVIIRR